MTKSSKSKILALALCAGVMSGIYAPSITYALPSGGQWGGYYPKDEQHVVFDNETDKSESGIVINNPDIKHPAVGNHTDQCGENLYDTDMTLGDFNKVVDKLVETDNNIADKVDEVASDVKDLTNKVNSIETTTDTDTHVKDGTYEAAENGDVTMDVYDKNGDTGKDVTITGLASDKELADQKSELEKADEELQGQIDDNKTAIDNLDGKVDDLGKDVTDIKEQIENIDVEDTNTQVNEGTYTAEADGTVSMDVVDKTTGELKEDAITIEGLASDSELAAVEDQSKDRDEALQGQIEENAQAIADETTAREEADTALGDRINDEVQNRTEADDKLQGQINDNKQAIADETAAREEADAQLASDIKNETLNRELADEKLDDKIDQTAFDSQVRDNELQNAIDKETAEREAQDTLIREDLAAETTDRKEADKVLQDQIDAHGQQIGDNTAAIKNHTSVIGVEDYSQLADKYADTNYISDATSMVEADQRLDAAISDVSTRVDGLENRVDGLEDRIDKVGANGLRPCRTD